MNKILLSIVTVCYNDLTGLEETFRSLRGQDFLEIEWIVVDGGSRDGTLDFLKDNTVVHKYVSESDDGIYDAMRKGLLMASGDYILFLNAGDSLLDANVCGFIKEKIGDFDVYFFDTYLKTGNFVYLRRARPLSAARYSVPAVQQSTVYRRTALLSVEWPREFKVTGDMAIATQFLANGFTGAVVPVVLSEFSLGGISTVKPLLLCKEAWRVQRKYLNMGLLELLNGFCCRYISCLAAFIIYRIKR